MPAIPLQIAVYGSASENMDPGTVAVTRMLGRRIAERGLMLITGACTGLPHEAVIGAAEAGGRVIGYAAVPDMEAQKKHGLPTEGYSEFVFVPREFPYCDNLFVSYKYRNVSTAAVCDAAIIVSGRIGTLNEYTLAYDFIKPIGALLGTGGVADMVPELMERIRKEPSPFICASENPDELLDLLIEAAVRDKDRRLV